METSRENMEKVLAEAYKKESKSVFGFFIKNFRFTYLIIIAIVFLGIYSVIIMPREADPEVKFPFALVTTVYPGASPTDIEELVTDEVENSIKNLENLRIYTSNSKQGFSSIFVEFLATADLQESYQKLRDSVDTVKPLLPKEAQDPVVTEIRASDLPIITYSLVSDLSITELKKYAEVIQTELESIKDVSKVPITGGLERELQVIVDQKKLVNFNISLGQVISAISRTNFNLPLGNIEADNFRYYVRVEGKLAKTAQLDDIVLATRNNVPIYLRDVATIRDSHKERTTISKIGTKDSEPLNTVSLSVYKKTGGNILDIVDESKKEIENLINSGKLPSNIKIEKTNDNSWFIRDTLNRLGRSGLQTMLLIVILLFTVLGLRGALITGLSVPLAFLMAFLFLYIDNNTLNSMVLFSLIISLGLMVDNSIIIMEGINEYRTQYKKTSSQAAILSVWNFKWAIISGTLTTVAAFIPMLLVSGILGEFFSFIPKTISATLLSSLFVALVIIPTLASRFIKENNNKPKQGKISKIRTRVCKDCLNRVKARYIILMRNILNSRTKRRWLLGIAWLCFILAVAVPASGLMKIEMFPAIDFDTLLVNVELPAGSVIEATGEVTKEVEKIIGEIPELKNYVTTLGMYVSWTSFEGSKSGPHLANVLINLTPKKERKRSSLDISQELRIKLKTIQGGKVSLEEASAGPPTGAPIDIRISGDTVEEISVVAEKIVNLLETISGVINVKTNMENASGEFIFKVNAEKASFFGLDTSSVSSAIRTAIHGTKASSVTLSGEDIDITVKYDKDKFNDISSIQDILIITPTGQTVPLKQITSVELAPALLSIRHRNGEKVINVSADIQEKVKLQKVLSQFEKQKGNLVFAEGINVEIGGEVEDIEQSYRELFLSMIVAVMLIAVILVLQFNSFKQPFIIMFTLPLAVIGVVLGLNILRMPFSFTAFLGIVSLAGIAVNDAIVLIDRVNKNLKVGIERVEAIAEAGSARMQPIFLTSLTTIFGVLPLVFADELWRGFSVALISGLIFSTLLTLIVIPILYNAITPSKYKKRKKFGSTSNTIDDIMETVSVQTNIDQHL